MSDPPDALRPMLDAPNPTDRGHEHLFRPIDVDRALELRRVQSRESAPIPSSGVLCAESVNPTATLRDTSVVRTRRGPGPGRLGSSEHDERAQRRAAAVAGAVVAGMGA